MASDVRSASATKQLIFTSKGGTYTAIFMADFGDLFQKYVGDPTKSNGITEFIPDFDPTRSGGKAVNLTLTVVASSQIGDVNLKNCKVDYSVSGSKIQFNTSLEVSKTGSGSVYKSSNFPGIFEKTPENQLRIVGNIAGLMQGSSFKIEASVTMTASADADSIVAYLPVAVSEFTGSDGAIVTIYDSSGKNFTLSENNDQLNLSVNIFDDKKWISDFSPYTFKWYKLTTAGWSVVKSGTGSTYRTLTVHDADVDSYADFRVDVEKGGVFIGSDTQNVQDASDPYLIGISTKIFDGTTTYASDDARLTDQMGGNAYMELTASLQYRNSNTEVQNEAPLWKFSVCRSSGLPIQTTNDFLANNVYRINKSTMEGWGDGTYILIVDAKFS
ncbi:MAG: hypothetical protein J1E95_04215 [Muribaculaceae bacterium]|nr:hypothetical protein [Muribaculaceae bacterium]